MPRRLIYGTAILIATLFLAATPRQRPSTSPLKHNDFSSDLIEHYLDDSGIAFIRPGLKIHINSVTIPSDRRPVVDVTLTDGSDQPIDRLGKVTPGVVTLGFVFGWYNPATRQYVNYHVVTVTAPSNSPNPGAKATQAAADSGGTFTDLDLGHFTYKFGTVLPSDFDSTKTHTLAIYGNRNLQDIIGKIYLADVEYDFRPDGQPVTETWNKINVATSCDNCHDPLTAHGTTGRMSPKTCALCHQPQSTDPDTGNTVDFKVLIHKIHMGSQLPSVQAGHPYQIIGFGQSVNDFSTVVFPQDIRNCATCHEGTDPKAKPSQFFVWYTYPSRAACGACHDDIDWTTGANHPGGPQADDSACSSCHVPDSGHEFDASIKGAHTIETKSAQLKGINASIVSATNVAPGQKPTVTFKVTNGDGSAIDASKLSTFAPIFGGPTTSYRVANRESAVGKATFDPASGNTTYTFSTPIPADATGTWTFSGDIYRTVSLKRADGKPDITGIREAAFNPIANVAITGPVTPRRTVVATQQCDSCHDVLALHGGQRKNTQECVICHNPLGDDSAQRPASANPPESISFQRMIHRIHTGEDLTQDFTIYGFNHSVNNFNDVRFPGDRRDCAKCHADSSYLLPLPTGIDSVITLRDFFSPQGPATAACLGCHDNRDAEAHAFLMTANFPGSNVPAEACATCHGQGAEFDVAKVHAR